MGNEKNSCFSRERLLNLFVQLCYVILLFALTNRVTASPNTAGNDDFSPKTVNVTFQPGETGPKAVPFNIIDDDAVEPNEEFTLTMSSSSPGVTVGEPATVVIKDNDKSGELLKLYMYNS